MIGEATKQRRRDTRRTDARYRVRCGLSLPSPLAQVFVFLQRRGELPLINGAGLVLINLGEQGEGLVQLRLRGRVSPPQPAGQVFYGTLEPSLFYMCIYIFIYYGCYLNLG